LIAADGAYSRINREFSVAHPMTTAVAIEFNLPYDANRPSDGTCFDFGAVPDGYGWVFPKDDQASVGLYPIGEDWRTCAGNLPSTSS
jgi:flavin-dependent dehydrogenase